jgi:glycosyltransferase involved in cell wall biosynthesis
LWTVNANAIVNADFQFRDEEIRARIPSTKRKFLWFGSLGLIHKGVDILMDALNVLPDCSCDFYGVSDREKELFMHLKAGNANYCGRINVQSRRFIDEVALDHCFLVFPSCSEGMSTAVCTCMAAGIIPIVTQVSGFDPHPGIIYLEDESVEGVANAMRRALEMPDEEILRMRRTVYEYANQAFSIQHFDRQFTDIMDELLEDAGV